jgi:hypothetical protein
MVDILILRCLWKHLFGHFATVPAHDFTYGSLRVAILTLPLLVSYYYCSEHSYTYDQDTNQTSRVGDAKVRYCAQIRTKNG